MKIKTRSVEETIEVGRRLGALLEAGDVVLLVGELGAGKTHFTRGIAMGLGVSDPYVVTSPTFILMNQYQGRCLIRHFDLYRIEGSELHSLGFQDFRDSGVSILEWGEKADPAILKDHLRVEFAITGENSRQMAFSGVGERSGKTIAKMTSAPPHRPQ